MINVGLQTESIGIPQQFECQRMDGNFVQGVVMISIGLQTDLVDILEAV